MNVKGQTMIVVCFFPSLLFDPLFFLPESFEFLFQSIAKFVFYSAQSAKPQFGLTQNWMPFQSKRARTQSGIQLKNKQSLDCAR